MTEISKFPPSFAFIFILPHILITRRAKKLEVSNNLLDLAINLGEPGRQLLVLEVEVVHLLEVAEDLGEPARELLVLNVKVSNDLLDDLGEPGRELLVREAVL